MYNVFNAWFYNRDMLKNLSRKISYFAVPISLLPLKRTLSRGDTTLLLLSKEDSFPTKNERCAGRGVQTCTDPAAARVTCKQAQTYVPVILRTYVSNTPNYYNTGIKCRKNKSHHGNVMLERGRRLKKKGNHCCRVMQDNLHLNVGSEHSRPGTVHCHNV
jgi:hypothetical protein